MTFIHVVPLNVTMSNFDCCNIVIEILRMRNDWSINQLDGNNIKLSRRRWFICIGQMLDTIKPIRLACYMDVSTNKGWCGWIHIYKLLYMLKPGYCCMGEVSCLRDRVLNKRSKCLLVHWNLYNHSQYCALICCTRLKTCSVMFKKNLIVWQPEMSHATNRNLICQHITSVVSCLMTFAVFGLHSCDLSDVLVMQPNCWHWHVQM